MSTICSVARSRSQARERESDTAADATNPVLQAAQRKSIKLADGVRWERLTPTPDKEVEFLVVVYDVGAESCPKDALIRHGGNEYAYMISGHLGIKIGFEEFELGPGDSIAFDAQMPHRLWTIGKEPAEATLGRAESPRRQPRPPPADSCLHNKKGGELSLAPIEERAFVFRALRV